MSRKLISALIMAAAAPKLVAAGKGKSGAKGKGPKTWVPGQKLFERLGWAACVGGALGSTSIAFKRLLSEAALRT